MIYGTKNPITDINFFRISTNKRDPKKISIPETMGMEPVPVKYYHDKNADAKFVTKRKKAGTPDKSYTHYIGDYNLTEYLDLPQSEWSK